MTIQNVKILKNAVCMLSVVFVHEEQNDVHVGG